MRRGDGGSRGALVAAVARTLPWRAVGAGAVVGLLVVALPRLVSGPPDAWLGLTLLRAAALVFALGLAFLQDDPARRLTTPVPTRRWVRTGLRVALVAPVAALWWTAVLVLVPEQARPPVGAITLEAASTAALALAAAAVAVRLTDEPEPGPSVASGVLTLALLAPLLLPARWDLFVPAEDPHWEAAHVRWAVVLVAAAAVLMACGPEPLRRRVLRNRPQPGLALERGSPDSPGSQSSI
ncbi:ABC transporter [Streptomyces sp. NPDC058307]|uniref:ABC transporter n=1 Tax=Streptomyces sp. NPDC058307 TaxID=3346439 RepID=UPI0036E9AD59